MICALFMDDPGGICVKYRTESPNTKPNWDHEGIVIKQTEYGKVHILPIIGTKGFRKRGIATDRTGKDVEKKLNKDKC